MFALLMGPVETLIGVAAATPSCPFQVHQTGVYSETLRHSKGLGLCLYRLYRLYSLYSFVP